LREEPAAKALLTLASLAHPHWNIRPSKFDVTHALMLALDLDLVRAQMLAEIAYRTRDFTLSAFEQIKPVRQERLTAAAGDRYSRLRAWLLAYREARPVPLDHFLRRLFGEVVSQKGFGFHANLDAARVAESLVESARKFRLAIEPDSVGLDHADFDVGREFMAVFEDGLLAAQYVESWATPRQQAVLIAPAYSFLLMNRATDVQFWLDPGSGGWYQRLDQPLTHTNVLSRRWAQGSKWTFAEEEQANKDAMARLVLGLLRRCRNKIFICVSQLGEGGFEQRGPLLSAFQAVLGDANAAT
jgi:hypothetical protein